MIAAASRVRPPPVRLVSLSSLSLLAALAAFFAGACGAEPPRARVLAAEPPRPLVDAGAADAQPTSEGGADLLPAASRIAESGPAIAPGMREIARVDEDAPFERSLVHAADKDTCVRVAFAASDALVVSLVDAAGAPLDATPRAASGVTSTVCVRRAGDVVLRVARAGDAGAGARVHAVAFAAP